MFFIHEHRGGASFAGVVEYGDGVWLMRFVGGVATVDHVIIHDASHSIIYDPVEQYSFRTTAPIIRVCAVRDVAGLYIAYIL